MLSYILRRLALIIPTLFGIMVVNFAIIQAAPGGPVEQMIAQIQGVNVDATARVAGTGGGETSAQGQSPGASSSASTSSSTSKYRGAQGLDPEIGRAHV